MNSMVEADVVETLKPWKFDYDTAFDLAITGVSLGAFHVFTPDHLSALSALSVGGSWKSFFLGVRWGIGH